MKILITGMNKNQSVRKHYLRQALRVVPAHYSLFNALVDMGHQVEQREVEIGEDLSAYDRVIVYIAGPRQLVATHTFRGLWAISQRPDCILGVDDWQAPDLFKGLARCRHWEELACDFILRVNKMTIEEASAHRNDYLRAVETIVARQNKMLVCAFSTAHLPGDGTFGPHLLFDAVGYPRDKIYTFNPNPYHRNRRPGDWLDEGPEDPTWVGPAAAPPVSPPKKERRFNFASLVQSKTLRWLKRQGYVEGGDDESGLIGDWRVDLYGSKAETQKRLPEDQMCAVIARDWGCLMPGYEHAGSGWWRARPLQCADAGSILIGDEKELAVYYGHDYPFLGIKATDLCQLTDTELAEIARTQREAIYRLHPLDRAVERAELKAALMT